MKKGNVLEKEQQRGEEGKGSFTGWYSRSGSFRKPGGRVPEQRGGD